MQLNSWDFPGELPGHSIDSLRSRYLQPISDLSDGDSTSALSSAPSRILTPTLEALSKMESMRSHIRTCASVTACPHFSVENSM